MVHGGDSMTRFQREFVRASAAITIAVASYSCAPTSLNAPSGIGVSSGIGRTGTSVSDARRYNDLAVTHNANASSRVQRIEAKAEVVARYWGK